MDFFSQHIIAPSAQHLKLLEFLAVVVYTIHLPYIALVLGATAVAMWLTFSDHELPTPRFARLAEELLRTFLSGKLRMLVLGVLPLLALPFLYGQWFVGLPLAPINYVALPIPGIILGLVLLGLYRGSFAQRKTNFNLHMGLGTLGLLLVIGSYFVLFSAVTRLQDPEKWFRFTNLSVVLLNWNVIWKFLFFLHLAFAVTGAGILFFLFRWSNRSTVDDPEYAAFVRKFAAGLGLAFCLAVPVFNLFYVFTSADVVFDGTTYVLAAAITFVCMLIAYAFLGVLRSQVPRYAATTFTLFMVVFVLSGSFDLRAMANANREHARLLEQADEKARLEREAEIEQALAAASGRNIGEETFKTVCMQCHRFNEKLVGPPLATVLPRYDAAALRAFISNPTKKDPNYPPMPNPGLSPAQVEAVAAYVLERLPLETGAQPAPGTEAPATTTPPTTQPEVQGGPKSH